MINTKRKVTELKFYLVNHRGSDYWITQDIVIFPKSKWDEAIIRKSEEFSNKVNDNGSRKKMEKWAVTIDGTTWNVCPNTEVKV